MQVIQDGPDSKELILLQDGMAALEVAGRTVRAETRVMKKDRPERSRRMQDEAKSEDAPRFPLAFTCCYMLLHLLYA